MKPTLENVQDFLCKLDMNVSTGNKHLFTILLSGLPELLTNSSKIAKFLFSKLFFSIENQWNLLKKNSVNNIRLGDQFEISI